MLDRVRPFRSILLCADRSGEAQAALRKASILARYLGAGIELFACDADHAWAVAHAERDESARAEIAACLAASRRYLAALRSSIAAADLRLSTRAACAASIMEGVADRVAEAGHDLVVKNFAEGEPGRPAPTAADLALAQACQVPLMLTRTRPWRPAPCIWAALDLQRCEPRAGRRVVEVARTLAQACHGSFSIVYSRSSPGQGPPTRRSLARAKGIFDVGDAPLHLIEGDAGETLPAALRAGGVDLLVIGQPMQAGTAGVPSLTEHLLGLCDCDALIVPVPSGRSAVRGELLLAALGADPADRQH